MVSVERQQPNEAVPMRNLATESLQQETPSPKVPLDKRLIVILVAAIIGIIAAVVFATSQNGESAGPSPSVPGGSASSIEQSLSSSASESTSSSTKGSSSSESTSKSSSSQNKSEKSSKKESSAKSSTSKANGTKETVKVTTADGQKLSGEITLHHGYVLPDSDKRVYRDDELAKLNPAEVTIAMNELNARYGQHFRNPGIRAHFKACDWYHDDGWTPSDDYALPEIDQKNYSKLDRIRNGSDAYKQWANLATH